MIGVGKDKRNMGDGCIVASWRRNLGDLKQNKKKLKEKKKKANYWNLLQYK